MNEFESADGATTRSSVLVSFDIDGTLEVGDPPGPIMLDLVWRAKECSYIVGSCSDRTHRGQREIWQAHEIDVDFVSVKEELPTLGGGDGCHRFIHIGDSEVDRHYARLAGFEFWFVDELPAEGSDGWIF